MRKNRALTLAEKNDARTALEILTGTGFSLTDAARIATGQSDAVKDMRVDLAIDAYMEHCRDRVVTGDMREKTATGYEETLNRYADATTGMLSQVDHKQIQDWLASLNVSPVSQGVYYRTLRAFFNWCVEHDLLRTNPAARVKIAKAKETEPEFLTVDACKSILELEPPYRHAYALALFAGLRPHEVARLDWQQVNRLERIIRVPGAVSKTGTARIIEGLPDTLWRRIADAPESGAVFDLQPRRMAERAKVKAKLDKWPQDALRHTFATYHVASFGDVAKTSLILGHKGAPDLLHRHYRGLATKAQGDAFWAI